MLFARPKPLIPSAYLRGFLMAACADTRRGSPETRCTLHKTDTRIIFTSYFFTGSLALVAGFVLELLTNSQLIRLIYSQLTVYCNSGKKKDAWKRYPIYFIIRFKTFPHRISVRTACWIMQSIGSFPFGHKNSPAPLSTRLIVLPTGHHIHFMQASFPQDKSTAGNRDWCSTHWS